MNDLEEIDNLFKKIRKRYTLKILVLWGIILLISLLSLYNIIQTNLVIIVLDCLLAGFLLQTLIRYHRLKRIYKNSKRIIIISLIRKFEKTFRRSYVEVQSDMEV